MSLMRAVSLASGSLSQGFLVLSELELRRPSADKVNYDESLKHHCFLAAAAAVFLLSVQHSAVSVHTDDPVGIIIVRNSKEQCHTLSAKALEVFGLYLNLIFDQEKLTNIPCFLFKGNILVKVGCH